MRETRRIDGKTARCKRQPDKTAEINTHEESAAGGSAGRERGEGNLQKQRLPRGLQLRMHLSESRWASRLAALPSCLPQPLCVCVFMYVYVCVYYASRGARASACLVYFLPITLCTPPIPRGTFLDRSLPPDRNILRESRSRLTSHQRQPEVSRGEHDYFHERPSKNRGRSLLMVSFWIREEFPIDRCGVPEKRTATSKRDNASFDQIGRLELENWNRVLIDFFPLIFPLALKFLFFLSENCNIFFSVSSVFKYNSGKTDHYYAFKQILNLVARCGPQSVAVNLLRLNDVPRTS